MKLYTESDLIELVQSLKDYTHESHAILGHDEREAKDFVDIFLKDRTPIELPSDDDMANASNHCKDGQVKAGFLRGVLWMKEQILNQNKLPSIKINGIEVDATKSQVTTTDVWSPKTN